MTMAHTDSYRVPSTLPTFTRPRNNVISHTNRNRKPIKNVINELVKAWSWFGERRDDFCRLGTIHKRRHVKMNELLIYRA